MACATQWGGTLASSTQRQSTKPADEERSSIEERSSNEDRFTRFNPASAPAPAPDRRATTSEKNEDSDSARSAGLKRPRESFLPITKEGVCGIRESKYERGQEEGGEKATSAAELFGHEVKRATRITDKDTSSR